MTWLTNPSRFGAPSSLLTSLVGWWALDETTGTRVDSHGAADLTMAGTVGYAAGKQGNAADFPGAITDYLSNVSAAFQGGNKDFTLSAWVKYDAIANGNAFASYGLTTDGSFTANDWMLGFMSSGVPRFYTSHSANWQFVAWSVALSTATWYHIVAWLDATAGSMSITVNNGTPVANASILTPTHKATANMLQVGKNGVGSIHNGLIDEFGYWDRVLTAAEITALYNSGNGIGYPG